MNQIHDFEKVKLLTDSRRKFGETYLVVHKTTRKQAALKLISKSEVSASVLQQLKNESNHSYDFVGLPKVICSHETDSFFSFVKEYQEGISWEEYTDQLSTKQLYEHLPLAVLQIIGLLSVIHSQGNIHGDVRLSNLLINPKSHTDFQMEIIDFGLSFPMGKDTKLAHFSLGYAAPELMLGKTEIANETTDFFALGITIIHLLTGKIPLMNLNPELAINLQFTHPIIFSRQIPKTLIRILEKMTYKYLFAKPPRFYSDEEVKSFLIKGMSNRFNNQELIAHWSSLELKQFLWNYYFKNNNLR